MMKNLSKIILLIAVMFCCMMSCVFADGMAPAINSYYIRVSNQNGAAMYQEVDKKLVFCGTLPYNTRESIEWEEEFEGKTYLYINDYNNGRTFYISEDDATITSENIEIYRDYKYKMRVINSNGINLYEGPSTHYPVVQVLPYGSELDCYRESGDYYYGEYADQWLYIDDNGIQGWFDRKDGDTLIRYESSPYSHKEFVEYSYDDVKIYKAVPFIDENVIYTIPAKYNIKLIRTDYEAMTDYDGYQVREYVFVDYGITGLVNYNDFPIVYFNDYEKFECKVFNSNGAVVYKHINKEILNQGTKDEKVIFKEPSKNAITVGKIDFGEKFEGYGIYRNYLEGMQPEETYIYVKNDNFEGFVYEEDLFFENESNNEECNAIAMDDIDMYSSLPIDSQNLAKRIKANTILKLSKYTHYLGEAIDYSSARIAEIDGTEYAYVNISGDDAREDVNVAYEYEEKFKVIIDGTKLYEIPDFNGKVLKENIPVGTILVSKYAEHYTRRYDKSTYGRMGWYYLEYDGASGWVYMYPTKYFAYQKARGQYGDFSEIDDYVSKMKDPNINYPENLKDVVYNTLLNDYNNLSNGEVVEIKEIEKIEEIVQQEIEENIENNLNEQSGDLVPTNGNTIFLSEIPAQELIIICIAGAVVLSLVAIVIIVLINKKKKQ